MHPYTTNAEDKMKIYGLIAFVSVVASLALFSLLKWLQIEAPWYIDTPSVIAFFGIFYKLFDSWLWKTTLSNKTSLITTPDFSGIYKGYILSSYDVYTKEYRATLSIKQTWTNISIILTTDNSRSESVLGMIITNIPDGYKLLYAYQNKPKSDASNTMHSHDGTANLLLFSKDQKIILEGDYYTGRDRQNHGRLYFQKEIII